MDVRAAEVFIAVAEELSFTRAAERLGLSTPTVSGAVRKLERDTQQVLFQRTSRSVELTPSGRALLPPAIALLEAHSAVRHEIDRLRDHDQLNVGVFCGLGASLLRRIGESLVASPGSPLVSVRVFNWSDPSCGLRTRECDVAILVGPTSIDSSLTRVNLGEQARIALLPDDPESRGRAGTVCLEDVDRLGWVPVAVGDEVWEAAWRLDDVRGHPPRLNGPVQSTIEGVMEAIHAGVGAAVMFEAFSELYAPSGIHMIPVRDAPPLSVDLAFRGSVAPHPVTRLVTLVTRSCPPSGWF